MRKPCRANIGTWEPPALTADPKWLNTARNTWAAGPLLAWLCWTHQVRAAIDIGIYGGVTTWYLGQCLVKPATQISVDVEARFVEAVALRMRAIEGLTWRGVGADSAAVDYRAMCDALGAGAVGLAYIDGGHSREQCAGDIRAVLPALSEDAVIVLHDYDWSAAIRRAVRDELAGWQLWHARCVRDLAPTFLLAQREQVAMGERGMGCMKGERA